MWKPRLGGLLAVAMTLAAWPLSAADQTTPEVQAEAAGKTAGGSPLETARSAARGSLKNPHADVASVAEEGHKIYMAAGCNGCHGGGGMAPPLTNPVWIYGNDDDTLFRLIALGSDEFQQQGHTRKGSENVIGPMPAYGSIVKSDDDMWKMIAWIRLINP